MQTTILISHLSKTDHARLRVLAARLDMEPELAAKYLLKAAVEALEPEKDILWPLYLSAVKESEPELAAMRA